MNLSTSYQHPRSSPSIPNQSQQSSPEPKSQIEKLKEKPYIGLFILVLMIIVCITTACRFAGLTVGELFSKWHPYVVIMATIAMLTIGWRQGKTIDILVTRMSTTALISTIVLFALSAYNPSWGLDGIINGSAKRTVVNADAMLFDIEQFVGKIELPLDAPKFTQKGAKNFILSANVKEGASEQERRELGIKILAAREVIKGWMNRGEQKVKFQSTPYIPKTITLKGEMPDPSNDWAGYTGLLFNSGDYAIMKTSVESWYNPALGDSYKIPANRDVKINFNASGGLYLYSKTPGKATVTAYRR